MNENQDPLEKAKDELSDVGLRFAGEDEPGWFYTLHIAGEDEPEWFYTLHNGDEIWVTNFPLSDREIEGLQ